FRKRRGWTNEDTSTHVDEYRDSDAHDLKCYGKWHRLQCQRADYTGDGCGWTEHDHDSAILTHHSGVAARNGKHFEQCAWVTRDGLLDRYGSGCGNNNDPEPIECGLRKRDSG